jgi:hypothetical protein
MLGASATPPDGIARSVRRPAVAQIRRSSVDAHEVLQQDQFDDHEVLQQEQHQFADIKQEEAASALLARSLNVQINFVQPGMPLSSTLTANTCSMF